MNSRIEQIRRSIKEFLPNKYVFKIIENYPIEECDNNVCYYLFYRSQNVTAVEYGLQKSSISRLNEYNKNYSPKENRTTNNEDRSKIEPHAKPTIKPFQCLRPIMEEKSNRSCLRLYRCGSCFEKYKSKEDCLRHIVENHAQVKKPVSPNTIFEMVYKNDDKIQFRDKNQSNVVSPIQNKSDVLHKAFSNGSITSPQTKVQNESPNKYSENKANLSYKNIANCENLNKQIPDKIDGKKIELKSSSRAKSNQVISMRMRGNQRKILHVDSFYKEIRKQCTRYICDVCGRIMTSKFAFQRHVNDHCGPNIKSEDTIIKKQEKLKQPLLNKRKSGYCKLCRKRISHWTRHAMYHAILKLEKKYPDIVRVLNSSS